MTIPEATNGSPEQPPEPRSRSWIYGSGGELRAVWRIGMFVSLCAFVDAALGAIVASPLAWTSGQLGGAISSSETIDALAALIAVAIMLRNVDGQPWSSVGLGPPAWRKAPLLRGTALGSATIIVTAALLAGLGMLRFADDTTFAFLSGDLSHSTSGAWLIATLRISLVLAPAALFEELVFRGYLWRVIEDSAGTATALLLTSFFFGLVHFQNPGVNALALGNVALAGVCLGLVRLMTGSLVAAWAAHFMWNWIMAAGLHVAVSGLPMATPGYRAVSSGPAWVSGGDWGPEGGIVATAVLVAAIVWGARQPSITPIFSHFRRRHESAATARSA